MSKTGWDFIEPLKDADAIKEFEGYASFKFSDDFIECAANYNGAFPDKESFDTEKKKECTIQHLLSFNKEDKVNIWSRYDRLSKSTGGALIPFAANDFGNLICFERETGNVVFWDHETDAIDYISDTFDGFLDSLY